MKYTDVEPNADVVAQQFLAHCEVRRYRVAADLWRTLTTDLGGRADAWMRVAAEIARHRNVRHSEALSLAHEAVEACGQYAHMA